MGNIIRPITDEEFNQLIDYLKEHREKIISLSWQRDHTTDPNPLNPSLYKVHIPDDVMKFIIKIYEPVER